MTDDKEPTELDPLAPFRRELAPSKSENVFYVRMEPEGGGREFEDIMMRRVPSAVAYRFRGAAGARSLTHAQYLSALVALHEIMRKRADGGDQSAEAVLAELDLGTVSI